MNLGEANQITCLLPYLRLPGTSSDKENALQFGGKVAQLVEELGLKSTLTGIMSRRRIKKQKQLPTGPYTENKGPTTTQSLKC